MKKKIKVIPFILAIFLTVIGTYAYYTTSTTLNSNFQTEKYVFTLNGNDGIYQPSNKLTVTGTQTTLPTPTKNGYTFAGYSDSVDGDINYDISIDDIKKINNKEIFAKWKVKN